MTCDLFYEQLPEYLDAQLDAPSLADAELHLATCAACRALVADLQAIAQQAATLPSLAPSRDLWLDIERRIVPADVTPIAPLRLLAATPAPRPRMGQRYFVWSGLAAAAVMGFVVLTSQQSDPRPVAAAPSQATPTTASAPIPDSAPQVTAAPVERVATRPRVDARTTYGQEIDRLAGVLQAPELLTPQTRAIVESSLRKIDSAIAEAEAALAQDPASPFLGQQLDRSLQQKLRVLRSAALLTSGT